MADRGGPLRDNRNDPPRWSRWWAVYVVATVVSLLAAASTALDAEGSWLSVGAGVALVVSSSSFYVQARRRHAAAVEAFATSDPR